jgi:hypothetical protein
MAYNQEELLKKITALLTKSKIPYMLTGAWSVIFYGRPRASHDIDIVVEMTAKDIPKLLDALKEISDEFSFQSEDIKQAVAQKSIFQLVYLPILMKIDFWLLKDDEFDETRFKRRKNYQVLNQLMTIASAEDTILKKLLWYSESNLEKHLIDAAFIYQIQVKLDQKYLTRWANKQKTEKLLKSLKEIDLDQYI